MSLSSVDVEKIEAAFKECCTTGAKPTMFYMSRPVHVIWMWFLQLPDRKRLYRRMSRSADTVIRWRGFYLLNLLRYAPGGALARSYF